MNIIDGITFDDVLLIPQNSGIQSRSDVDISVDLGKGVKLHGPFISANMKTVTGPDLAKSMYSYGMGILHRFDSIDAQIKNYFNSLTHVGIFQDTYKNSVGISVGIGSVSDNDKLIQETDAKVVCIDVAHGDHSRVIKETARISKKYPDVLLIAGNVATAGGAKRLAQAGADVIKVGIGPGSLCTTRVETGNGVPQLTALELAYDAVAGFGVKIIADGGIKSAGDIVKALCFSHSVMLGSVLAGTDEAPGKMVEVDGRRYKEYSGSSTHKTNHIEGVSGLTPHKGSCIDILRNISQGLRSGLSYQGCSNLEELRESPQFVRISSAGLRESHPHAVLK